jgi:prevent-host-death family protein
MSVRDLRNHTADVVAAVRAGERLSLTVNRLPVADIVPHSQWRSPWVPAQTLREIVEEAGADPELLDELGKPRRHDVWIAATALQHGAAVVTQDADFGSFASVAVLRV